MHDHMIPEKVTCQSSSDLPVFVRFAFVPAFVCVAAVRSSRPSRLRREKAHVKSQRSCSGVQLAPLRVLSASILNDVNANQVGVED